MPCAALVVTYWPFVCCHLVLFILYTLPFFPCFQSLIRNKSPSPLKLVTLSQALMCIIRIDSTSLGIAAISLRA